MSGTLPDAGHTPVLNAVMILLLLLLAACESPTRTETSIDAEMVVAPGESIVLLPSQRKQSFAANRKFVQCLRRELTQRPTPHSRFMDTTKFQDQMFPWFEGEHMPKTVRELDGLLSRPKVRERIASLKVRYLISFAVTTDAEGFPGILCGAGYGGGGCLGVAWERETSKMDAVVWDLKTAKEVGTLSATASGRSLALGVIIPIVFIARTQKDACKALAKGLGDFLDRNVP